VNKGIPGLLVLALATGCGSAPPETAPVYSVSFERFSAPIGEELRVDVGDHIFAEGEVARARVLRTSSAIASTMPGAYGFPISFRVDQTNLDLGFERGIHEYFCAPTESRTAFVPNLDVVVAPKDCIGVRRNKSNGTLEWVVDYSYHNNGMTTVWTRELEPDDGVEFFESTQIMSDGRDNMEAIYFQGYYSDLLHFEYRQIENGEPRNQEFKFDYPPKEGEAVYGVRGKIFEVLAADNTEFKYKWVSIPN
jgi:hypothetical protein